jgi:hypothetical protein
LQSNFNRMNKIFTALLLSVVVFVACNKNDTDPLPKLNLADTSETKAFLDTTNFGIYKGVLTGTTGRIKLYFNNGDIIQKAIFTLDSLSDTLVCMERFVINEPVIAAFFQGRISSLTFTTDANGKNASLDNIIIRNRINVFGVIAHESKTDLVYCYESKFTGSERGNFNFITYGNQAQGLARNALGETFIGKGLLTGSVFKLNLNGPLNTINIFQGGIEGTKDYFSGSWAKSTNQSGVFSGVRTQ